MSFKNASEYVISFISKYGDDELLDKWNNNEFKKIFNEKKIKTERGPKKNKSGYIFFCNEEREKIKSENLNLNNKEILSELAVRWNKIKNNSDKIEKYTNLAEQDKIRYSVEIKNYNPSDNLDELNPTKKNKEKTNIKKNKVKSDIKKNKSSYMFFCIEERENMKEENLQLSHKEIIKELGNRWNKIKENPDNIKKYTKLAENDKKRYENEKNNKEEVLIENAIENNEIIEEEDEEEEEVKIVLPKKTKEKVQKKKIVKK